MVGSSPSGPTKGTGIRSDKKDICTKVGEGCRAVVAVGDWLHVEVNQKTKYKKEPRELRIWKDRKLEHTL